MKTYYFICKAIAVLPFILLLISMPLLMLGKCEGNEGTGIVRCQYLPDGIGSVFFAFALSSAFGFPGVLLLSGLLSLLGKIVEKVFIRSSDLDDSNL